jgi:hypothetical protein
MDCVAGLNPSTILGRGAASFFALPINLERMGIKKAPVLPEPMHISIRGSQRPKVPIHTGLGHCNQILIVQNSRDCIGLNSGWAIILAKTNVVLHNRVQTEVLPLREVRFKKVNIIVVKDSRR